MEELVKAATAQGEVVKAAKAGDDKAAIKAAVDALVTCLVDRNGLQADRIVSVTFSVTADLDACFPAAIARRQQG